MLGASTPLMETRHEEVPYLLEARADGDATPGKSIQFFFMYFDDSYSGNDLKMYRYIFLCILVLYSTFFTNKVPGTC